MHIYLMSDPIKEYSRVASKPMQSKIKQWVISLTRMLNSALGLMPNTLVRKSIHTFTNKSMKE